MTELRYAENRLSFRLAADPCQAPVRTQQYGTEDVFEKADTESSLGVFLAGLVAAGAGTALWFAQDNFEESCDDMVAECISTDDARHGAITLWAAGGVAATWGAYRRLAAPEHIGNRRVPVGEAQVTYRDCSLRVSGVDVSLNDGLTTSRSGARGWVSFALRGAELARAPLSTVVELSIADHTQRVPLEGAVREAVLQHLADLVREQLRGLNQGSWPQALATAMAEFQRLDAIAPHREEVQLLGLSIAAARVGHQQEPDRPEQAPAPQPRQEPTSMPRKPAEQAGLLTEVYDAIREYVRSDDCLAHGTTAGKLTAVGVHHALTTAVSSRLLRRFSFTGWMAELAEQMLGVAVEPLTRRVIESFGEALPSAADVCGALSAWLAPPGQARS